MTALVIEESQLSFSESPGLKTPREDFITMLAYRKCEDE
jgi:hypothetical protein